MLSVTLLLKPDEAEALASVLAASAMDNELPEPVREAAAKAVREIERTRVAAALTHRKSC